MCSRMLSVLHTATAPRFLLLRSGPTMSSSFTGFITHRYPGPPSATHNPPEITPPRYMGIRVGHNCLSTTTRLHSTIASSTSSAICRPSHPVRVPPQSQHDTSTDEAHTTTLRPPPRSWHPSPLVHPLPPRPVPSHRNPHPSPAHAHHPTAPSPHSCSETST